MTTFSFGTSEEMARNIAASVLAVIVAICRLIFIAWVAVFLCHKIGQLHPTIAAVGQYYDGPFLIATAIAVTIAGTYDLIRWLYR